MLCRVTVVVELEADADIVQMEHAVQEAGRQAMRSAMGQLVRAYEKTMPIARSVAVLPVAARGRFGGVS